MSNRQRKATAHKHNWGGLCLLVALLCGCLAPAQEEVERAPEPGWVKPVPLTVPDQPPPADVNDGIWYLLVDQQVNADADVFYSHQARQLLSPAGVESGSQITITFDPTCESLTLHQLRIHRNGTVTDRLADQSIRVLAYENAFENHLYDGRQYALLVLEDIRPGDIIEYAFSRQGVNPIFGGRYIDTISTEWSAPVLLFRHRLLHAAGRRIDVRSQGHAPSGRWTEQGGQREGSWEQHTIPALIADGEAPGWYVTYGSLQFSEFPDWASVADWAIALHALPTDLPADLAAAVERIRALPDEDEQILAAYRFVQEEIRYVGIEIGVHSHKPYPLATVLQRRFGDCKDKARTLCALLNALGYEAYPALVATDERNAIADHLPSPLSFNHVVVLLRFQGRDVWLDPTAANRRGPLESIFFPNYGRALVLAPGTDRLTVIPDRGADDILMEIIESFSLPDYDGDAELVVRTTWRGWEADSMRANLEGTNPDELKKRYANYYANLFPGVEAVAAPVFEDDTETNTVTAVERYRIRNFWETRSGEPNREYGEFYAQSIRDYLQEPTTRLRTTPFALSYPVHIRQQITVDFPDDEWAIEDSNQTVRGPGFELDYATSFQARTLTLDYRYKTTADHVQAADVAAYLTALDEAKDLLGYEIWISDGETVDGPFADFADLMAMVSPASLMLIFVTVCLGLLIAARVYNWRPVASGPEPVQGVFYIPACEGFLTILCAGLAAVSFWEVTLIAEGVEQTVQSTWVPSATPAVWLRQAAVIAEITLGSLLICLKFGLLALLVNRRRTFPRVAIVILCLLPAFCAVDLGLRLAALAAGAEGVIDTALPIALLACLVGAMAGIPYLRTSQRVQATFNR